VFVGGKKTLSAILAIMVAVSGLLIFSPLHVHDRNAPTKCSLNNLDAHQAEGASVVFELAKSPSHTQESEAFAPADAPERPMSALAGRAPPAHS
jgi:hypothetical protein